MNAIKQVCLLLVVILRRIDLIDLLFLALAFFSPQPPLIALLALQAIGRRYWRVAVGLLQIAGVQEIKEWHCNVLPGARVYIERDIMLLEVGEEEYTSAEPLGPTSVLADTDAIETDTGSEYEPPPAPLRHNLSRLELLTLLAVQKNAAGGYRYSANAITAFVGGTRSENLEVVSSIRGVKKGPAPTSVQRPARGW
jgi:hypothetical protein